MSVHYKFKSALEYDTVTFDGLHISVKDLKNSILQQKRIGKSTDFDLQVTNAQTKEVYEDENALIPKNTSLLIARIPVLVQKNKPWEGYGGDSTPPPKIDEVGPIAKAVDLASLDAPEDDKIKAMMSQSTQEYDPSNYVKIRGANQVGAVPPNYRCYKCHQGGHWIKDCTFGQGPEPIEIKKSTGIPRNFLVPVEGPQVPGAMMTPNGQYAVPILDLQAYNQKVTPAPVPAPKIDIPEDLICSICLDLLADAVMIPCCGNSFCDECIRSVLLESEDHECPDCHEKEISPDTLIPNRFLRTSVSNFKNTTGYVKKPTYRERIEQDKPKVTSSKERTPPQEQEPADKLNVDEKTVISEADSTEHTKVDEEKDGDSPKDHETKSTTKNKETGSIPEGPPGVSPKGSPGRSPKDRDRPIRRIRSSRDSKERTRHNSHSRHREDSPRKGSRTLRSPNYNSPTSREERSGTPTVDEPTNGVGYSSSYGNTVSAVTSGPLPVPSLIGQIPPIQGPPPHGISATFPPGQPPIGTFPANQGPIPNYRLPPPGSAPFMGPGPFSIPPRAMFDGSRPPLGGFPPNYNPNIPPGSRSHRDFNRRRDRTPPGLIDDPLAAFNRMLREKDERKRRAKRRSYSRSRSRSRSFSRSPVRRRSSRSPRPNRRSRSRSRSFSLSRSRSRSYTGSPWGSPYNNRQASPPARRSPLVTRRGAPTSRYRSPPPARPSRSPPPRSRHPIDRHRDFEDDRDYADRDRAFKDRNRDRGRNSRDRRLSSRDRDRYYDNFDDRSSGNRNETWPQSRSQPIPDSYYPPSADIQQSYQTRFGQGPPRDYAPPYMNKEPPIYGHPLPTQRQFQDIKPPGVDDDIAPPGVDEPPPQMLQKLSPKHDEKERDKEKERDRRRSRDRRDRSTERDRKRRHDRKSRTPDRARNPSPKKKSKSRDRDSPDRHKRRRKDSSDRDDKKREHSEDEKSRKSRDKKKHKDKKESDKKKKRDKKDKHKKESKEKKPKEEFKQVIPKNREEDSDEDINQKERKKESYEKNKEDVKRRSEEKIHKDKKTDKMDDDIPVKEEPESGKKKKDVKVKRSKDIDSKQSFKEGKKKEPLEEKEEEHVTSTTPARIEITDLYGDISNEDIDTKVMENYGKIEEEKLEDTLVTYETKSTQEDEGIEEGEIKEFEEEESEEKDILELHLNDIDLKTELDKSDILAPVPEKSKWEVEEDILTSPRDSNKSDLKIDKSGKVTNEVLKRAENAIFAKAIKAIRPLEIKKREVEKSNNKIQVTVASAIDVSSAPAPQRLSVKERLGIKVDDPDKVINLSRNRSRSVSPFSRRGEGGRNFDVNERRVELESIRNRRLGRNRSRSRGRDHSRDRRVRVESRAHVRDTHRHGVHSRDKNKKEERSRHEDDRKSRRKRTRSRSESEEKKDRHKKRDKKQKKEKTRKTKDDIDQKSDNDAKDESKPNAVAKRKPTIDEATFEPDYDLETHSEEEEETSTKKKASKKQSEDEEEKSSSSESDSDTSSEEDRKKKKHKKHKKRKKKESSSSSSSESESESSDSDRGKKKKKHKKNKKKKKKSKHK